MNQRILAHRQRIDHLFQKISSILNPADQSEWSKYLCVLVSGYIEESLRVLLEEYAYNNSSSNIQNFVAKEIKNITNCSVGKIENILSKFDSTWKDNFTDQIASKSKRSDEIKNSINSVVTNRHQIAHGKNISLNYSSVSNYYKNVKVAVEILENIIK